MLKLSTATRNALLNDIGLKDQLDGGKLYLFAGPLPATADEALDLVNDHTECVVITDNGAGAPLTFDTPTSGVLNKAASQVWKGTVALDGAEAGAGTATPTFYRFCAGTDNGRGAANASTGYRVQGTVGGPNSGADLQLGQATLSNGNEQAIGAFGLSIL